MEKVTDAVNIADNAMTLFAVEWKGREIQAGEEKQAALCGLPLPSKRKTDKAVFRSCLTPTKSGRHRENRDTAFRFFFSPLFSWR